MTIAVQPLYNRRMELRIDNIEKSFAGKPVLRGVSLVVNSGEVVVLLGPSGCGKTTLLRIIAGLEMADNGRLFLDNSPLTDQPVHKRNFGFVFQDYALFPHKNVAQNVAFGLRMQKWEPPEITARVDAVLSIVGLDGFGKRAVHELSGGEQQRVALARSLAPSPRLLLLDEPLGALDRALRERLMVELRTILKRVGEMMGITAVYVTHDQAEAFAIADQVVVMNNGRVEQHASPDTLYRQPRTPFVARFLGMANLLPATIVSVAPLVVATAIGKFELSALAVPKPTNSILLIRPEAAELTAEGGIEAVLQTVSFRGRYQQLIVTVAGGTELKFELETAVSLPPIGSPIHLHLNPHSMQLL